MMMVMKFKLIMVKFKDHIFSEYFKFNNVQATSSLDAISLLDDLEYEDGIGVLDSNDDSFANIYYWKDDGDGVLESGEYFRLSDNEHAFIDFRQISTPQLSDTVIGSDPAVAYVLRTAEIT